MSAPPTPYVRSFDFNTFSTSNPLSQQPGLQIDGELNSVLTSIASLISRLSEIQRPDGALANLSVGPDQITPDLLLLLGDLVPRGAWLTATAYAAKDLITNSGVTYVALATHTSGVFATDLAANKWMALNASTSSGNSFKGNNTGSTGPTLDLTIAQARALLAYTAALIPNAPVGGIAATNVQAALNELDAEKAPIVHTHVPTDITGLSEAIDDRVAALIQVMAGITATYDDALNTLTLALAASTARKPVGRRQTVRSGPVTTAGLPNFGGGIGATSVTVAGTLVVAAAGGSDANGDIDYVGSITNPVFNGLSVNGTMTMFCEVDVAGVVTTAVSSVQPVQQFGGTPGITNGLHTFNVQEMKGYLGNGATAPQAFRVPVGEVTVAGGIVTNITWYALNGLYVSPWTTSLPNTETAIPFTHALGTLEVYGDAIVEIECVSADNAFLSGDRMKYPTGGKGAGATFNMTSALTSRTTMQFATGQAASYALWATTPKGGGVVTALTVAKWKYRMIIDRGW